MPSPFPGMDPWLERPAVFPAFHNTYIACLQEAINVVIPSPFFAAIGTRVLIEGDDPDRLVEPDVDILKPANGTYSSTSNNGGTTIAEPVRAVTVHVPRDQYTEWLLEIRTGDRDEQLITTIELLSRSNKKQGGLGRSEYLRKQREMQERRINIIEIDLLRVGVHTTLVPLSSAVNAAGQFDYHICVYRPDQPEDMQVYPILLPQHLPRMSIPLTVDVPDIQIDCQWAMDRSYDVGLHSRRTDYNKPCDPPLTEQQQTWAETILRDKGLLKTQ